MLSSNAMVDGVPNRLLKIVPFCSEVSPLEAGIVPTKELL